MRATSFPIAIAILILSTAGPAASSALAQDKQPDGGTHDWRRPWTVVTLARKDVFGIATRATQLEAILESAKDCKKLVVGNGDCFGTLYSAVQQGWTLGYACGDLLFLGTGATIADARVAVNEEIEREPGYDKSSCTAVIAVDPNGKLANAEHTSGMIKY